MMGYSTLSQESCHDCLRELYPKTTGCATGCLSVRHHSAKRIFYFAMVCLRVGITVASQLCDVPAGSDLGGERAAAIYTLIETCKLMTAIGAPGSQMCKLTCR